MLDSLIRTELLEIARRARGALDGQPGFSIASISDTNVKLVLKHYDPMSSSVGERLWSGAEFLELPALGAGGSRWHLLELLELLWREVRDIICNTRRKTKAAKMTRMPWSQLASRSLHSLQTGSAYPSQSHSPPQHMF